MVGGETIGRYLQSIIGGNKFGEYGSIHAENICVVGHIRANRVLIKLIIVDDAGLKDHRKGRLLHALDRIHAPA